MTLPTLGRRVAPSRHQEFEDSVDPLRHPGRWVSAIVIVVALLLVVRSVATNERIGWDVVGDFLFSSTILAGVRMTLLLTVVAMIGGTILGTVLAIMRGSANPILRTVAGAYVWFFRGIPLLVQFVFWYNFAAIYPTLFGGITVNDFITPLNAAILGLIFNEAAYMAEIVRGGIQAVDPGQRSAAESLGMTPMQISRRIVLPQALKVIIPPTSNELINVLKFTSIASVLALPELLYSAQLIYSKNFQTIPLLIVASLWYLFIVSILTIGQHFLEKRLRRSSPLSNSPR